MNSSSLRQWAFTHSSLSRLLIALLLVLTGFIGFSLGFWVIGAAWYEAGWPLWLSLGGVAGLFALRWKWNNVAPNRQAWRWFHIATVVALALLSVHIGSRFPVKYGPDWQGNSLVPVVQASAARAVPAAMAAEEIQPTAFQRFLQKARRQVQETPLLAKIMLTLIALACVVAVGYVVAVLACGLACSDLAILAGMVILAGFGGALVGGYFWILRIWAGNKETRKKRKEERKAARGTASS